MIIAQSKDGVLLIAAWNNFVMSSMMGSLLPETFSVNIEN